MERRTIVVYSSKSCPFNVEAVRYMPEKSYPDGITLILMHGINLHKETFEVFLSHLMEQRQDGLKFREAWSIDNPNCGRSSDLNQEILSSASYKDTWNGFEYARAVNSFLLATSSHGVDFQSRNLTVIAHSSGALSLMLLLKMKTAISFRNIVLLDPALLPLGKASSRVMTELFRTLALSKKHTWPSREAAQAYMSRNVAYRNWHPRVIELFVEHALRRLDSDSDTVTLSCSSAQEAGYFASESIVPPAEELMRLCQEGQTAVHVIVGMPDEFRGKTDDLKSFLAEQVGKTKNGSVQRTDKGGHMFPQVVPNIAANLVTKALSLSLSQNHISRL